VPANTCEQVYNPATDGQVVETRPARTEALNNVYDARRACKGSGGREGAGIAKARDARWKSDADPMTGTLATYPGTFLHIGPPTPVARVEIPGG
jgi:hypothetical protein